MRFIAVTSTPGEWAAAIGTLLGAIGAFITAMYSLKLAKNNKCKIESVHQVVNGNTRTLERRNNELVQLLQSHQIEIPPKKDM